MVLSLSTDLKQLTIYGNIVVLCEGPEIISLEACWKLISTLRDTE